MSGQKITGGCQCGTLRYVASELGRASICHCRMCQKAMGNIFAPLVEARGFTWVRGEPARFSSSNVSNRGFCSNCGTPITLETDEIVELAIGTLDDPHAVEIEYQTNMNDSLLASKNLHHIPLASNSRQEENDAWNAKVVSYQHPDHPTDQWEVRI